jgi:DNA-binding HxlR family transcriptional regulator
MARNSHEGQPQSSPLGRALVLLGDMWTLRIVMLVFTGRRRFQDLRTSLSISDPVLSRRLTTLIDGGVLQTRQYQSNPPRNEYLLTDAGLELWPILVAIWVWDRRWAGPLHRDAHTTMQHTTCGHAIRPVFGCAACHAIGLGLRDMAGDVEESLLLDTRRKRSRRSPSMTTPIDGASVLGDRWSTFLLSDAFTGHRRFNDFQASLQIAPVTLTQRLQLFLDTGLMTQEEIPGRKRTEYRLTPKALDFFEVTTAINHWAQTQLATDGHSGLSLTHIACGAELVPQYTCNACNNVLDRRAIRFVGEIAPQ